MTTPASAAEAIRLLRKQDAGRAALLLAGEEDASGVAGGVPASSAGGPLLAAGSWVVGLVVTVA